MNSSYRQTDRKEVGEGIPRNLNSNFIIFTRMDISNSYKMLYYIYILRFFVIMEICKESSEVIDESIAFKISRGKI